MKEKATQASFPRALFTMLGMLSGTQATDKEVRGMMKALPAMSAMMETFMLEPDIREVGLPFLEIQSSYLQNLSNAHKEGKKIAFENFNFPPAILYAMDVVPLSPEVISSFLSIGVPKGIFRFLDYTSGIGIPETMCTAQRGGVGVILSGLIEKPDMVLNMASGSCDTNSKMFDFISEYLHIPFCNIDAPPYWDEGGEMIKYYQQEYRKLVAFLEEQTGNKLDEDKLRQCCKEAQKQDEYVAEIYDLRRAVPNPVPAIFNFMMFGTRFMSSGTPQATKVMETMYEVVKERYKKGEGVLPREKARAGFVYLGHFTMGGEFWRWLEHNGISLIMEGLAILGHQHYTIDTSTVDTMLDSLAGQAHNNIMTKQIRGPLDYPGQWFEDIATLSKDLNLDCAIYLGTLGCKNTWGGIKVLMKMIEEELEIPTLIMHSDSWDDRVTPWPTIRDQIEEFINTVVVQ